MKSDDCNGLSRRYKVPPLPHIFLLVTTDVLTIKSKVSPFPSISAMSILPVLFYSLQTLKQYKLADLTPMESGCCRPPAEYAF